MVSSERYANTIPCRLLQTSNGYFLQSIARQRATHIPWFTIAARNRQADGTPLERSVLGA